MSDRDYGGEYSEARSRPTTPSRSPRAASPRAPRSDDGGSFDGDSSGRRTPPFFTESTRATSEAGSERSFRVGNLILQAAQQAQQAEQAQATARTAAQIAAQARKMRSRTKRVMPAEELPEAEPYDMEGGLRGHITVGGSVHTGIDSDPSGHEEYRQGEKGSPTAKDIRGQNLFSYDGKAYNLPLPPAFALLDINKPGRRGPFFSGPLGYRICVWTTVVIFVLSFVLALSLLTAYLTLEPQQPSYNLDEIRIQTWYTYKDEKGEMPNSIVNGTAQPTVYLYADVNFAIKADNPNRKLALHYVNTTLEVKYQGVSIGSAYVSPHVLAPGENKEVLANWKCDACAVMEVGHYLEADDKLGSVPLHIVMTVDVTVEAGGVMSPGYLYVTEYDVKIKPPAPVSP